MNLEVKARFVSQSHDLSENVSDGFGEQRVENGMDEFGVAVAWMLVQDDMVLHEEVRYIVVEIHIFTNDVDSNELIPTENRETHEVG